MAKDRKVFYWWLANSLDSLQPPYWSGTVWMQNESYTRMFWTKEDLTQQQVNDCDLYSICFGTFSEMITARIEQRIDERSIAGEFEQDFRKQTEDEDETEVDAVVLGQVALF